MKNIDNNNKKTEDKIKRNERNVKSSQVIPHKIIDCVETAIRQFIGFFVLLYGAGVFFLAHFDFYIVTTSLSVRKKVFITYCLRGGM